MLGRASYTLIVILLVLSAALCGQTSWEEKNRAGEKAFQEGKLADANRLFLEALQEAQAFGQKDLRLAPIYNNLALIAFVRNNYIASESMYEKAIAVVEGARGPEDPLLLPILENLTRLYVKQWSFNQAIQTSQRICAIREKKPGPDSPETALSLNQLATLYLDSVRLLPHSGDSTSDDVAKLPSPENASLNDAARLQKADELYRRVLAIQEKNFGGANSRLVDTLQNLGEVQHDQGDGEKAEQSYTRAARIIDESFGRDDLKLASPLQHIADLKSEQEAYPQAEEFYKRALQIREKRLGENDPALVSLLTGYAAVLEKTNRHDEARKLSERAATLSSVRKSEKLKAASASAASPYIMRFERAIYDRYAGVHQSCMLVRADGRIRIEEQQREGRAGSAMAIERSPDGMGDTPAAQEHLQTLDSAAHPVKVFEFASDDEALQQLQAILSAKNLRTIHGSFAANGAESYYGTEKIAVSVLRDDAVQNFSFPDVHVRQPYEESLRPLFKWLTTAEKRKGGAAKDAVANSCAPDLPPAVPTQFGPSRSPLVAKVVPPKAQGGTNAAVSDAGAGADVSATIKVGVNLVLVRVVVRDSQGNTVGNLQQQDFQLFDDKKARPISRFAMEKGIAAANQPATSAPTGKSAPSMQPTERSIAYFFDDINLAKADLSRVQSAAEHQISALPTNVQTAVFTTSGNDALEFTTDRTKLRETLLQIKPRKGVNGEGNGCPDIDTYMADLIWNKQDEDALGTATEEALTCAFADNPKAGPAAESLARATAHQQYVAGEADSLRILLALQAALRKLAAAPGQHTLVFISPGFFAAGREQEFARLIDGALHSDIVISALDARGLYNIDSVGSRSRSGTEYRRQAAAVNAELLTTLADSTGGTFFHNSNDFDAGFGRVSEIPEYSYVLGFAPSDQELDGRFHPLSVKISNTDGKIEVRARKGYYATPRPSK